MADGQVFQAKTLKQNNNNNNFSLDVFNGALLLYFDELLE